MIVIATSDKGGTGRSVTGSNVVYRRALQGGDVCYVDFDFGSPTAGAIFGISALTRGTTTGKGTHSYLLGRSSAEEVWDVWQHSDRTSLRQRPPGTGQAGAGTRGRRRGRVLLRRRRGRPLHRPLPPAAQRVRGRARGPERRPVVRRGDRHRRHLVAGTGQRDHAGGWCSTAGPGSTSMAANGLVFGERGLLDIGEAHGLDRDEFIEDIRFVRTAIVDPNAPDLAGLRPPQLAWLREANRDLQRLAAELNVGRSAMLGAVPLDPVLQWREQLITDSDVWARHVANQATIEAFDSIAKKMVDDVRVGTAVSEVKTEFLESSADFKVESLPLSHVSVEVGHLYMEDFVDGESAVRRTFAAAAPWVKTAQTPQAIGCEKKSVRVSTCFLIDDYFSRFSVPAPGDPDGAGRGETGGAGDRLPGARVGLRGRGRRQPGQPHAGEPGDRAGTRDHRRAAAAHRDRLADQRAAVAEHRAGRGDGQAHALAAAAGERAPTALHLRRRRTLGRARRAANLVVPDAGRRLAVDAAGPAARPGSPGCDTAGLDGPALPRQLG